MPAYGVFARHVKDLELANIRVGFEKEDLRPAMVCMDVTGLEIDSWDKAMERGRILCLVHDSAWFDVGTPEGLAGTEARLAERYPSI